MADYDRIVLSHYNISNPYPTEWPADKDESDASENEKPADSALNIANRRSKSRYSVLERNGNERRSLVPGSEKTRDGIENLVQNDEADPLGATDSVVRALRQKGLPVEEDQRLRKTLATVKLATTLLTFNGREPLSALLHYIHARSISISGPCQRFYSVSSTRPRISLPLDRPEVSFSKDPR